MNIGELVAILRIDDSELGPGVSRAEERMNRMGAAAGVAGAAAGAALGAGLSVAMTNAIELDSAQAKLEAQLGGAGAVSERAGAVAGQLYASAYGENMSEVNEAVRMVMTGVAGMADASAADLQRVTGQVMSLSQAFDQDLGETTRAVDQMLRTGLAPSAEAALDILARGFQTGVNEGGDLLEVMSEYGTVLRDVGLDGQTAMGLMSQGLQAGARDADTVADALKEFAIRAQDGSTASAEGFAAIGLSAEEMTRQVAAGGPGAAAALDTVLDRLRGMEDPVERNAAAVALFGTKAEDLGDALFSLDPSSAVAALGDVTGAAATLDATIGDTAANKVTAMQRGWEQWSASLIATEGPMGTAAAGVAAFGPAAIGMAGSLAMIGMAIGPMLVQLGALAWSAVTTAASWAWSMLSMAGNAAMAVGRVIVSLVLWAATTVAQGAVALGSMIATGAAYVLQWVIMAAGATARAAVMAASWLIAMGPVGWVIAAVVGLVALIIANWDTVKAWTIAVWSAVSAWVGQKWAELCGFVERGVAKARLYIEWFKALPILIGRWFGGMVDAGSAKINELLGWLGGIPGRALAFLGGLGGLLVSSGRALVDGFLSGIQGAWNRVVSFVRQGVQWVRDLFPFSPAKTGPFSGSGYVTHSGKALTGDFADSLRGGMPGVVAAARGVMSGAHTELNAQLDARTSGLPGDGWLRAGANAADVSARAGDRVLTVTINNPIAERASDTIGRKARTLAALGPFSGGTGG